MHSRKGKIINNANFQKYKNSLQKTSVNIIVTISKTDIKEILICLRY